MFRNLAFISANHHENHESSHKRASENQMFSKYFGETYELSNKSVFSWSVVEEKIITEHFGFMFSGNHYFYDALNAKIFQLFESGISDRIVENEKKGGVFKRCENLLETYKKPMEENFPVVLTVYHFQPWFYALSAFLSLALAVFVIEIIVNMFVLAIKYKKKQVGKSIR